MADVFLQKSFAELVPNLQCQSHSFTSATRWVDGLFKCLVIYGNEDENLPNSKKLEKVHSKILPKTN